MAVRYYDWIAHHARRAPDKLAAIDLATVRRLSYGQLEQRVDRLAAHLRNRMAVAEGERVAVLAPNSTDVFEIQFACARIGAIFVPLNWRLSVPELESILRDADPHVLIFDSEFAGPAAELLRSCGIGQHLELNGTGAPSSYEQALAHAAGKYTWAKQSHDDVSTILYTSGTTGQPKGALITHRMTFYNAMNISPVARITARTVCLTVLPLFHTGGLNVYANPTFHAGGTVVVMRAFDPAAGLQHLTDRQLGITHFLGVPANYQFMSALPAFADADFSHLEVCGIGAAPASLALLEAWAGKGLPLAQTYGMTETGPILLMLDPEDATRKVGSSGPPILHAELRLVDQAGQPPAPGEIGEIWVRGPTVTPGYWNRPEATREAFRDGWLRTGDAVRVDEDGYYYVVDRWKDMYITGGENVYPADVENVLYTLEAIAEVAVIGIPDERWGEVGRAVVVLKPGARLDEAAVLAYCNGKLASYKMPRSVVFVDALPRNATGKLLKRELRDQAAQETA